MVLSEEEEGVGEEEGEGASSSSSSALPRSHRNKKKGGKKKGHRQHHHGQSCKHKHEGRKKRRKRTEKVGDGDGTEGEEGGEEVGISFHQEEEKKKKKKKEKRRRRRQLEMLLAETNMGDASSSVAPLGRGEKRGRTTGNSGDGPSSDQIQHFHITETLPEHFKQALAARHGSLPLLQSVCAGEEMGRRNVAVCQKEVRSKQKGETGRGGELSQSVDENIGKRKRKLQQTDTEEEEADSRGREGEVGEERRRKANNRLNPLKLIRRTNRDGGWEKRTGGEEEEKEEILVDLAADEDEEEVPKDYGEMEEYLRRRVPYLHVSLVPQDDDENMSADLRRGRAVVRLQRLSRRQIESSLSSAQSEEEEEQLPFVRPFGKREGLKGFRELSEEGKRRERDTEGGNLNNDGAHFDIYQTSFSPPAKRRRKRGRPSKEEKERERRWRESFSTYRLGRRRHSNKEEERPICDQEEEEEEVFCNDANDGHVDRRGGEGLEALSRSVGEWKLDEQKSDKGEEANEGSQQEEQDDNAVDKDEEDLDLHDALQGDDDDATTLGGYSLDRRSRGGDSRDPNFALVTPDNDEDKTCQFAPAPDDGDSNDSGRGGSGCNVVTGSDPMISNSADQGNGNGSTGNFDDNDGGFDFDSIMDEPPATVSSTSSSSGIGSVGSGSSVASSSSSNGLNMPILFSDDGNVQDFSALLNFQSSFEMNPATIPNNNSGIQKNISNPFDPPPTSSILHATSLPSEQHGANNLSNNESATMASAVTNVPGNNPGNNDGGDGDDDNEVLCLTPVSPLKTKRPPGRPRKYPLAAIADVDERSAELNRIKGVSSSADSPPPPRAASPIPVPVPPVPKTRVFRVVSEDDDPPDGRWMHCERQGCEFYTRKPWKMDRHRLCHVEGDSKYK